MMNENIRKKLLLTMFVVMVILLTACNKNLVVKNNMENSDPNIINIQKQGSFLAGGTVVSNPGEYKFDFTSSEGQTLHGDHAYIFYQTPVNARKLPLVFLHGAGQSSKTWESTPDGREGFQNIFLKKGYPVYLIDQPRRGKAGTSTKPIAISAAPMEQIWYEMFRIGKWPNYFPGVQFSNDSEALNQYFRQITPNTGPYDEEVISDAVSEVFNKIGKGILVTHSQGGGPGWLTAIKNENVSAVVAYEPGSGFVFPKGEAPEDMPSAAGTLKAMEIPLSDFMKLTKMPIVIYYGDNIPETPSSNPGQDNWRVRLAMAKIWAETINKHGGDATVVHLPEIGIYGNTHFPFSDLNNLEIADLLSKFLEEKKLDSRN